MNWGIIATGTIADKFARTVNEMKNEGEKIVAVASRNNENARAFAQKHGIENAFSSYEELASFDGIDAVYIATPNSFHYENTKLCLSKNKNVLCEKPFTFFSSQAKELYNLAESKNLFLMEGLWIYFLPLYKNLVSKIQNGEFGKLKFARCDYAFISKGERRERKLKNELGGGTLCDIGVYTLGFLNLVMGESPISFSSCAKMNEYGTDESSAITLEYSQNRMAQCAQAIGFMMPRSASLFFENAAVQLADFQNATSYTIQKADGKIETFEFPFEINGFEYEIREFSSCAKNGKTQSGFFPHEKSVALLSLIEKIRKNWAEQNEK